MGGSPLVLTGTVDSRAHLYRSNSHGYERRHHRAVLKDLRVTGTSEGQTIIGAAILDDVLDLIVLAVVVGSVTEAVSGVGGVSVLSITAMVLKAAFFLGMTIALGHLLSGKIVGLVARTAEPDLLLIIGIALCFTFAHVSELIGLAEIIGAFAAEVFLDPYGEGVRSKAEEATLREVLPLFRTF
jgi:Kef-type K+ transport system membrane component KefB